MYASTRNPTCEWFRGNLTASCPKYKTNSRCRSNVAWLWHCIRSRGYRSSTAASVRVSLDLYFATHRMPKTRCVTRTLKKIYPMKGQLFCPQNGYKYIGHESTRGTPTTITWLNSNGKSNVGMVRTHSWCWRRRLGPLTACCTTLKRLTVRRSTKNTSRPYYLEMFVQFCGQRCLLLTTRACCLTNRSRHIDRFMDQPPRSTHKEYEPTDKPIGQLRLFVFIVFLLATCPEVDRICKMLTDPGRIAWRTGRSRLGSYDGAENMCDKEVRITSI